MQRNNSKQEPLRHIRSTRLQRHFDHDCTCSVSTERRIKVRTLHAKTNDQPHAATLRLWCVGHSILVRYFTCTLALQERGLQLLLTHALTSLHEGTVAEGITVNSIAAHAQGLSKDHLHNAMQPPHPFSASTSITPKCDASSARAIGQALPSFPRVTGGRSVWRKRWGISWLLYRRRNLMATCFRRLPFRYIASLQGLLGWMPSMPLLPPAPGHT